MGQHDLIALKKLYQGTDLQYISSFKSHELYTRHSKRTPTDSSERTGKRATRSLSTSLRLILFLPTHQHTHLHSEIFHSNF